jgi:transposase
MPFQGEDIVLSNTARAELEEIARSQSLPAGFVLRARIILLLADGCSYEAIQAKLDTTAPTISRWKKRFLDQELDGFETQRPGQPPQKLTAKLRGRILEATRRGPRDGSTHWSCRKLAGELDLSKDLVHRVWREAGLKPHRLERYMASDDPDFERKAADIIGLYLNPPQHAAVFCIDEKTAIQALDRRDRVLPLSPGRAERHGFEYKRNGTLSLYAALNTKTGTVQGRTAARHTTQEFVTFLQDVVSHCEAEQEIHIICDNLSAHKTQHVDAFLAAHPSVRLHFTPTYSSWLNQVELWFSKLQRDVIARGIFTSVQDLARKLRRYINAYSKNAQPIHWKYSTPKHRIRHANTSSATLH